MEFRPSEISSYKDLPVLEKAQAVRLLKKEIACLTALQKVLKAPGENAAKIKKCVGDAREIKDPVFKDKFSKIVAQFASDPKTSKNQVKEFLDSTKRDLRQIQKEKAVPPPSKKRDLSEIEENQDIPDEDYGGDDGVLPMEVDQVNEGNEGNQVDAPKAEEVGVARRIVRAVRSSPATQFGLTVAVFAASNADALVGQPNVARTLGKVARVLGESGAVFAIGKVAQVAINAAWNSVSTPADAKKRRPDADGDDQPGLPK